MPADVNAALEALADPTRRLIFERIVTRPRRVNEVAEGLPVTRPAVSYHVRILREAGLVQEVGGRLEACADALPALRVYFDRLWLEASVGDTWLRHRGDTIGDLGL